MLLPGRLSGLEAGARPSRAMFQSKPTRPDGNLEVLYRRYGGTIYARCRRLLRDDALAEDATQDVFLRVMKHLAKAPTDKEALGWIYRISTNYCLNLLRNRASQAESVADVPEQPGLHPEGGLIARDLAFQALQRAPTELRSVAMLHFVDGLEQGRVAEVLGVSRRTVINRLGRFAEGARQLLGRDTEAGR